MKMKSIVGVTHPLPTEYAQRIYDGEKDVFVGKRCLCKVSKGNKFILYESHGTKAYTGWADIKYIGKIKTSSVTKKYGKRLLLSAEEFTEYSKGRKEMFVIEFNNFERFKNPVVPERFVSISGKYIDGDEYKIIESQKD